jgi:hypothetical protein
MMNIRRRWTFSAALLLFAVVLALQGISLTGCGNDPNSTASASATPTQFIFTSDAHYGIFRTSGTGTFAVVSTGATISAIADSHSVNAAMIAVMNSLPTLTFPADGGINAGKTVSSFEFIMHGGDIANRMEVLTGGPTGTYQVQSAATSWDQFKTDYIDGLTLKTRSGSKTPLYMIPGNHDISNAIGYYKTMSPLTDATSIMEIFNRMTIPAILRTAVTYSYTADKVYHSKTIGGVHFMFVGSWPDSIARDWMRTDLATISATTPAVIVAHDEPVSEAKHFTNPNAPYDINSTNKFENVTYDTLESGLTSTAGTTIEQERLVEFLKDHKNIVAYFHGNDHINGVYKYTGPQGDISLNVVRVDSPMKGIASVPDPTQLAFKVVAIDADAKNMTVRDYNWMLGSWGTGTTWSLAPRSK